MANACSAVAVPVLCTAMSAVEIVNLLHRRPGASATVAATAPAALHSGVRDDLLPLASTLGFYISVGFIYRHVHRGGGGVGNRRLPEMVPFMLCVCAGVLQFVLTPGGADVVDHGAQAPALAVAALRVLPAAATVTFFLGTMLIVAAHIRAGGEGGGTGAVTVAGEEPILQAPLGLRLLSRMALAAAAGLVCLMAIANYGAYY